MEDAVPKMLDHQVIFRRRRPEPGSNLNNQMTYRVFSNCPEKRRKMDYFVDGDVIRHWCLMAEILEVDLVEGVVIVKAVDSTGDEGEITFTDAIDEEKKLSETDRFKTFKPGHTIVVLYPFLSEQQTDTADKSKEVNRVHVKKESYYTIFPVTLASFYHVQVYFTQRAQYRVACAAPDCLEYQNLKACSGCHSVEYCGREHQVKDWAIHKQYCKTILILEAFRRKNWAKATPAFNFVPGRIEEPFRD
ncbi:hypothetical protein K474DRAFT_1698328 [Panus rudis PR-1116 ss-1]|nr:hypothetical protein K474DRAFT_1698328 [Panus rudis PR-1116 ss-1]